MRPGCYPRADDASALYDAPEAPDDDPPLTDEECRAMADADTRAGLTG